MESRIITMKDKLEVVGKELILDENSIKFLTNEKNPYLSARNKEGKISVFALWEKIHYGILTSNIMCILEEGLGNFIGSVFKGIKGITDDLFTEEYYFRLVGEDKRKVFKRAIKSLTKKTREDDDESTPGHARMVYANPRNIDWGVSGASPQQMGVPEQPVEAESDMPYATSATSGTYMASIAPEDISMDYNYTRPSDVIAEELTRQERVADIERHAQEIAHRLRVENHLTDEGELQLYREAIRQASESGGLTA